jgi:pimeloyl-ACP methyl ester carboxylesterase
VEDYADWLQSYIRQKGYGNVVLVGHSLGGAIILMYALKYPQHLNGLVLIGTGAKLRVRPDFISELERAQEDESLWCKGLEESYRLVNPEARAGVMKRRITVGPRIQLNDMLCCNRFDIMDRVGDIKLPALVLCGTEDEQAPVKFAHYLATNIEGAEEVVIDGATHQVALEKPSEVNEAIERFITRIKQGG